MQPPSRVRGPAGLARWAVGQVVLGEAPRSVVGGPPRSSPGGSPGGKAVCNLSGLGRVTGRKLRRATPRPAPRRPRALGLEDSRGKSGSCDATLQGVWLSHPPTAREVHQMAWRSGLRLSSEVKSFTLRLNVRSGHQK